MKSFQFLLASILILVSNLSSARAQQTLISDPKADFLAELAMDSPNDQLLELVADVNYDGLPDVFLAYSISCKDTADVGDGYAWSLYVAQPGGGYFKAAVKDTSGHTSSNRLIDFRKDAYVIGYIPEIKQYGLLTLDEGMVAKSKGPQVRLRALVIVGNSTVQDIPIGVPVYDYASAPLKKRFPATLVPPVQTLPAR